TWTLLVVWVLLIAAAVLARGRLPAKPLTAWGKETGWLRVGSRGSVAVLAVLLVGYLWRSAVPTGVVNPDVWNFWLPKAKSIFFFGGLDTGPSGFTSYDN